MEDVKDLDGLEISSVEKSKSREAEILSNLDAKERDKLESMIARREKMVETKETVNRFFKKPADVAKAGHDKLDAYKQLRQARQEVVLAKTNGFDTKQIEDVLDKYEKANVLYQKKAGEFQCARNTLLDSISDRFGKIGKFVNEQFDKVATWLDDKRASVMAAVVSTKEAIELANGRFATEGKTVYVGLNEKVASIERAWMQINYSLDQKIVNVLDNVYEKLQDHYKQFQAMKDIWHGAKEVKVDGVTVADSKQNVLNTIKSWSDGYKKEMDDLKKDFELSRETSIWKMNYNQEIRESYGLKKAPSLEEDMKKAVNTSIERRGGKETSNPQKEGHTKNESDR